MRKWIAAGFLVVLVALAVVILRFPADRALALFGPEDIHVEAVSGTIWNGTAQRMRHSDAPPLEDVHWRIRPASLLRAEPAYDLRFDLGPGSGAGVVAFARDGIIHVSDTVYVSPATGIGEWLDMPWLRFAGEIRVEVGQAQIIDGEVRRVLAELEWTEAAFSEPMRFPMGTVRGRLAPHEGDDGYRAAMEAEGGLILLRGEGWLDEAGAYELEIRLRPASGAPAEVHFLLDAIASRDDGDFVIRQRGRID